MKKVLLFLFLSFPVILTWGTTVSVWQGSKTFSTWSDVLNISGSNFSKVKADDVVVFCLKSNGDAKLQVSYGSAWTNFSGLEALPVVGDYSMVVTTQTSSWLKQGIHNLLWVWTSEIGDDDWYPGDDYVDIVARDGYPKDNNTHLSQAADFRRLRQAHPNKMTALPETNSVPSWENMVNDNALWLIVAPWCGGTAFDNGNTADFWQHFLNDAEGIISRNEVK